MSSWKIVAVHIYMFVGVCSYRMFNCCVHTTSGMIRGDNLTIWDYKTTIRGDK